VSIFFHSENKLGMYIHIPVCLQKCHYCDFYSIPLNKMGLISTYTNALLREIDCRCREANGQLVDTVYLGGGTPSLLSAQEVKLLLDRIRMKFLLTSNPEITLEVNPATISRAKVLGYIEAGVNRLSVGAQSFIGRNLKVLGRLHTPEDILETVDIIRTCGIKNLNLDLIYGIPAQSQAEWETSLKAAVNCHPEHISVYLLEPGVNTPLRHSIEKGRIASLAEDTEGAMYDYAIEYLADHGFTQYELSNFSLPGQECRHNLKYWKAYQYIGLGAGAVSFDGAARSMNKPVIKTYIDCLSHGKSCPVEILESMSDREVVADALILGLRLCAGINLEAFKLRFNTDIISDFPAIIPLIDQGLLEIEHGYLRLTRGSYFVSNQVFYRLII
jgi:oxygen-independent coproporphyrinogen-3 oxidase